MIITQKRRSCLFNGCTARKKIRQATQRLEYPIFIGFTLHVLRLWLSHDMVMPSARFDETGELILNEPSNKPTLTNLASSFNSTLLSRPPILAEVDYTVNQNAVGGSINVTPQAPAPIFVVSLPKSGTTSIHHFFECGGFASVHFRKHPGPFLGSCIKKNIHWKRKPFEDCGPFNVWSDPNYIKMNQCYHPAVKHLEKIMKAYAPNITLVLSVRNPKKWLKSLQLWDGKRKDVAPMWIRLQTCEQGSKFPNQYDLGRNVTDQDFLKFYAGYTRHVRRQAARFNVTLIEVDLEESTVGDVLSRATGIDSTCWGHYNVGRYHSVPNNVTQAASIATVEFWNILPELNDAAVTKWQPMTMAPVIQKYCQYLFVTSIALYEAWRILGVSTRSFSFRLKTSNQNVLQVQSLSTADLPPVANQVPTPLEPSSSSIVEVPIGNTTNVESETVVQSVKSSTKKKRSLIPTPVFVTSLSKSGTTSVHHFFRCGKYTSTHFKNKKGKIGSCVASNVRKGRLPFEECGHYKVWADATDITRNHCYHVAVNDLEPVIAAYAPNMTVILSIRNPNSWLRSVKNWDRIPGKKRTPKLWDRLQTCERGSKFPNRFDLGRNITDQDFLDFYQWHADYVRRVAAQYQVKFVEVNIEDDRAGEILSNSTGIKSTCWGQYNVGHYSGQNTTHQKLINDESPSN